MKAIKVSEKTERRIYTAEREAAKSIQRASHTYRISSNGWVQYTGTIWAHNCAYSNEDLIRNGEFCVVFNPHGEADCYGYTDNVTKEIAEKLIRIEENAYNEANSY